MTTRATMVERLREASGPTRTVVLEAHCEGNDPEEKVHSVFGGGNYLATDDAFLFRVFADDGEMWIDQLGGRFWSVHSSMPMRKINPFLHEKIERRRDLDWMWLPSGHLENLWPDAISNRVRTKFHGRDFLTEDDPAQDLTINLSGRGAERLLRHISNDEKYRSAVSFDSVQVALSDPDLGRINEGIDRMGRFAVSGDLEYHFQFVDTVVHRYARLVELCEARAIDWSPAGPDGGAIFSGNPIAIRFSRQVPDLEHFVASLFASRQPFRLWGVPQMSGDVATVEAVDLHVGHGLRLEIGMQWMRVYLDKGTCGNTVARLVSNLQHRFDSQLRFVDPELQAALEIRGEENTSPELLTDIQRPI
ncbi:hypothetical protein [Streptomyces heilongjiangensis]|uniref:Uncharacterized protein n=1 Tax=Streptomyces heilongjiangensis TaxID=945052 RepID=A0ABW1BJS8_9ACTN|nr:hypothetical protein [Streptomyces heilongjiangensis]MDC2952030.1 hypothetical protein [Streptomyces heilongjiangensis]